MEKFVIFLVLSLPVIYVSRKSLASLKSHGYYRFFAWECILWLFVSNIPFWFTDPFSVTQLVSWFLLIIAVYPVVAGSLLLKNKGKSNKNREDKSLYNFEKTTALVDTGIYQYIRHPLYASLVILTWGIFFKHITLVLLVVSLHSTVFLYITARRDEKECLAYFGEQYREYIKKTKMFIPYIF
jgi:protein-S-isoprenylcysteine O-methyltransferase Ste14